MGSQQLWIYCSKNMVYSNGKTKIANETIHSMSRRSLDLLVYSATGIGLCKFAFDTGVYTAVKCQLVAEAWEPLTPDQIAEILTVIGGSGV